MKPSHIAYKDGAEHATGLGLHPEKHCKGRVDTDNRGFAFTTTLRALHR